MCQSCTVGMQGAPCITKSSAAMVLSLYSEKLYDSGEKLCNSHKYFFSENKANLRDLIAATGLVILLKIGIKSSIFLPM